MVKATKVSIVNIGTDWSKAIVRLKPLAGYRTLKPGAGGTLS